MQLFALAALENNYIWLLTNQHNQTIIVDPGIAQPVIEYLRVEQLVPIAIFLTHHHQDHIAGVADLIKLFPQIQIYAPYEVLPHLPPLSQIQVVDGSSRITLCQQVWQVIATPGHTLGHVSYYSAPYLFCGDTLFSGGCGRIFEGTAAQLYQSLCLLSALPDETQVCAAHEYTYNNLCFAAELFPKDRAIQQQLAKTRRLLAQNLPTLPSTLVNERKINIFLRCQDVKFCEDCYSEMKKTTPTALFSYFRMLKDNY